MSDEIEELTKRVNEIEARLRDQRSTAMFAAAGAAILLGSGVYIGHALHAEPAMAPAPQPVVVTVSAPPAAVPPPPLPSPVVVEPSVKPTVSAPAPASLSASAPAAVVPVATVKRPPVDHGF